MTEDEGMACNTSQLTEDNVTPKRKKKKHIVVAENGIGDSQEENVHTEAGISVMSSGKKKKKRTSSGHNLDSSVLGEKSESAQEGHYSVVEGELLITKMKKKKADVDENFKQEIKENGLTEENDTSIIEDANSMEPHKKKKKKKADTGENFDHPIGDEWSTSFCTSEADLEVTHKKKKKKKKDDLNETVEDVEVNHTDEAVESCNVSMVEEDVEASVHKKKKKKKKRKHSVGDSDQEQSTAVPLETTNTEEALSEVDALTPGKKKKKRKREKSGSDSIPENESLALGMDTDEIERLLKGQSTVEDTESSAKQDSDVTSDNGGENESLQDAGNIIKHPEMGDGTEGNDDNAFLADSMEKDAEMEDVDDDFFTMIDEVKRISKKKVERVLPDWLANPTTVSMNLADGKPTEQMTGMDLCFLETLRRQKIKTFFPIQAAVIPELLTSFKSVSMRYRPRDICISAPTGSGKTLSYVLPIVQTLRARVVPQLRALVLLPTQDLARQVFGVFRSYTKSLGLTVCLSVGNHSIRQEEDSLVVEDSQGHYSADIMIATIGRLTYHVYNTKGLNFKYLRFLVLDEVDLFLSSSGGSMMLKLEKLKKRIQKPMPNNSVICGGFQQKESVHLPEPYLQQILVSATLMHDPEKLKVLNLYRPKLFITRRDVASNKDVASEGIEKFTPYMPPEELTEEFVVMDPSVKPLVLHYQIINRNWKGVLVFTKSTIATHTLSTLLSILASKRYTVAQFSSKDSARANILEKFSKGKIDVLISSDAMARGIDITNINRVISYDVPSLQTYVHRIGRTARAGKQGVALSLVEDTPDMRKVFRAIYDNSKDRLTKVKVPEKKLRPYATKYQKALETLKNKLQEEKKVARIQKKGKVIKGNVVKKVQGKLSKKTNIKSANVKPERKGNAKNSKGDGKKKDT